VPLALQTATETLAQKAIAAGIPGIRVDGNDAIASRHIIGEAVERARRGEGPTVVEAMTYRLSDHTTADDATRYRSADEVQTAWTREPIKRLHNYLVAAKHWDDAQENALKAECAQQVEAAVSEFLNTPKQDTDSMFEHLFATLPRHLKTQQAMARHYGRHK
jgi:2-oxoisovalerate dehydrogenase E1 component alpha subunit